MSKQIDHPQARVPVGWSVIGSPGLGGFMRGWRNTVELVLFEIPNSMKPHPSVFHAYTGNLRLVIGFLSQTISMRLPTVFR